MRSLIPIVSAFCFGLLASGQELKEGHLIWAFKTGDRVAVTMTGVAEVAGHQARPRLSAAIFAQIGQVDGGRIKGSQQSEWVAAAVS